jgi:DNA invertase Pin-like site-specific DNA recombinase
VFGAIAHFEWRLISERITDGIAAARARGKRPGHQRLDITRVDAAIKLAEARMIAPRNIQKSYFGCAATPRESER